MPEWVLPPRRDTDRTLPRADAAGSWLSLNSYVHLNDLASELNANADVRTGQDLVSVPDAWGHIDTFRMALSDEDHALHANAVREWRALLALFALGHRYQDDTPLDTREVPLEALGQQGEDGLFGAVLSRLLPPDRLEEDMNWGTPVLILLGGVPVGIMAPSTLVAPARGGLDRVRTQRPWLRNGEWQDPAEVPGMVKADLACLRAYLDHLRDSVQGMSGGPLKAVILRELNAYAGAVSAALAARGADALAAPRPHPLGLRTGTARVFHAMRSAFELAADGAPNSELILPPRPGLPEGFRGGVLMDARVADALQRDPDTIICWEGETLARVTGDPAFFRRQAQRAAAAGYLPLTLDDLFTPTLAVFEDATQCTGHPTGMEGGVLPLTPLALLFMDPNGLRQSLRVPPGYTETVVQWTIQLQNTDGGGLTPCPLRRSYAEAQVTRKAPPLVFLWPNFRAETWSHYYTYSSFDPTVRYGAKDPVDPASLTTALQERLRTADGLDRAFVETMARWSLTGTGAASIGSAIARTKTPPEALVCGGGAAGDDMAGLLLLPSRERPATHGRSAIIGVDFGTTNTCVHHLSHSDGLPRPLTFQADRVWWPYRAPIDTDRRKYELPYAFLPAHETKMPFRTLLYKSAHNDDPHPIRDTRIVFPVDVLRTVKTIQDEGENNFYLDIKWADQDQARAMNMFMSQLVVMAMAEMVADGFDLTNVQVRFSYPEAFSARQVTAFKQALRAATGRVEMGHAFNGVLHPESVAASYYFRKTRNILENQPFITLDVGGHTSDAAIWLGDQLLWKGSLEIGGRDLLIRFLAHHRDFFAELLHDDGITKMLQNVQGADQVLNGPVFSNVMETIVNSQAFTRAMDTHGPGMHTRSEMVTLWSVITLTFAGILHYLAWVLRYLRENKILQAPVRDVTLCFGGRGSQMFHRFCHDNTETQTALSQQFLRTAYLGEAVQVHFQYSSNFKEEVAAGLTHVPENQAECQARFKDVLLAERLNINTTDVNDIFGEPWGGVAALIDSDAKDPSTDLEEFRTFLANAARAHQIHLTDLTEKELNEIARRVEGVLAQQLESARDARQEHPDPLVRFDNFIPRPDIRPTDLMRVQPPFIVALRRLAHAVADGRIGIRGR